MFYNSARAWLIVGLMSAVAAFGWAQASTDSIESEGVRFGTGSSIGTITEKMRITQSGLVGIRTASPTATLTVNGTVSVTDALQISGTSLTCTAPIAGSLRYTSGTVQVCDGSNWGNIGIGVPTGTIMAFAASSCPSGWTPYTPAYGRFLRGIDLTGSTAIDPSGTRTAGGVQNDAFQGHWHGAYYSGTDGASGSTGRLLSTSSNTNNAPANTIRDASTDGINGMPRTAVETRPKNVAVLFCQYAGYQTAPGQSVVTTLASLTDVNVGAAATGQVLTYSGGTWIASTTSAGSAATASSTGAIQFNVNSQLAGDTNNLFWDDANDRLGIGTPTPTVALHVVGDIAYTGVMSDVSDRRMKRDINTLSDAVVERIMVLKPVTFRMKDAQDTEYGFIAQDVQQVFPELVRDGEILSLNYVGLIAPAVKTIQLLKLENDEQSDRIDALAEQNRLLRLQLKELMLETRKTQREVERLTGTVH